MKFKRTGSRTEGFLCCRNSRREGLQGTWTRHSDRNTGRVSLSCKYSCNLNLSSLRDFPGAVRPTWGRFHWTLEIAGNSCAERSGDRTCRGGSFVYLS